MILNYATRKLIDIGENFGVKFALDENTVLLIRDIGLFARGFDDLLDLKTVTFEQAIEFINSGKTYHISEELKRKFLEIEKQMKNTQHWDKFKCLAVNCIQASIVPEVSGSQLLAECYERSEKKGGYFAQMIFLALNPDRCDETIMDVVHSAGAAVQFIDEFADQKQDIRNRTSTVITLARSPQKRMKLLVDWYVSKMEEDKKPTGNLVGTIRRIQSLASMSQLPGLSYVFDRINF